MFYIEFNFFEYGNISVVIRCFDLNFDINSYLWFFLKDIIVRVYLDFFFSGERIFLFLFEVNEDILNKIEGK